MSDNIENHIGKTIILTKKIETLLRDNFGAKGKGLHSQVSSVQDKLSSNTIKSLRWIATLRNKVIHEDNFQIDNLSRYEKEGKRVIKQLELIILIEKKLKQMQNILRKKFHIDKNNLSTTSMIENNVPKVLIASLERISALKYKEFKLSKLEELNGDLNTVIFSLNNHKKTNLIFNKKIIFGLLAFTSMILAVVYFKH